MKVSTTGLLLASLCGSAFAAPIDADVVAKVGVNTGVNGRGENANVDATGGQPLGAHVNGVIDAREETLNAGTTTVEQLLDASVNAQNTRDTDANVNVDVNGDDTVTANLNNFNAKTDTRDGVAAGVGVDVDINVGVDTLRRSTLPEDNINVDIHDEADILRRSTLPEDNINVDIHDETDILRRSTLPEDNINVDIHDEADILRRSIPSEGNFQSTVANVANTVTSATGADTMNTANNLSPEAKQLLEAMPDGIVDGLQARDLGKAIDVDAAKVLDGVIADDTVNAPISLRDGNHGLNIEVKTDVEDVHVLRRSIPSEENVQSTVVNVGNTVMSATGADATKTLDGVKVDGVKAQTQSLVQDVEKTLNTREIGNDLSGQLDTLEQNVNNLGGGKLN